mmetsp:Transcript_19963/g.29889  ORF Transcript_19963/g.29889 Transcript_19963/m.29889 type:complete len:555 (+) Transcript_19963:34-1698(+)
MQSVFRRFSLSRTLLGRPVSNLFRNDICGNISYSKKFQRKGFSDERDGNTFKSLGLPSYLFTKMENMKFNRPTLIQSSAIPLMLRQKHNPKRLPVPDLIITDMTGSGKTLSFVLPLIANTDNFSEHLQSIIVVPTRELSVQTTKVIQELCRGGSKKRKANPVRVLRVSGQVGNNAAVENVQREKPHILIGTPTILKYILVESKALDLSYLTHTVLDEIDQLLSTPNDRQASIELMGLKGSAEKLNMANRSNRDHEMVACTQRRQLIFVSASITQDVDQLAKKLMQPGYHKATPLDDEKEFERRKKHFRISGVVADQETTSRTEGVGECYEKLDLKGETKGSGENLKYLIPAHLQHSFITSNEPTHANLVKRAARAIQTLKRKRSGGVGILLFVKSRHLVEKTVDFLKLAKLRALGVHQSTNRQDRSRAFRLMSEGQIDVLVGTDMLARGLDINGVSDVINVGVPRSGIMYMHRAGRAGRLQGRHAKDSKVISVVGTKDVSELLEIAKEMHIPMQAHEMKSGKFVVVDPHTIVKDEDAADIDTNATVNKITEEQS